MGALPKVIVAGGGVAFVELQNAFPPTGYNLFYADSLLEAAEMAPGAAALVIDAGLPGGGLELCLQLRAQSDTAAIPLVLRVPAGQQPEGVEVDAVVAQSDLNGLIRALQPYLVQRGAPPPSPAVAPRPATASPEPPPPAPDNDREHWDLWPPELAPGEELMEYSHDLSGFLNALLERLARPEALSGKTAKALKRSVNLTLERVDQLLLQIQSAINEALMSKDLARTKVLSSTKNSLYDKLQRLRALASKIKEIPDEPASEPPARRAGASSLPAVQIPLPGAGKKSALTRAAEAKRSSRPVIAPIKKPLQRSSSYRARASARHGGLAGLLPGWMWAAAGAGLLIIGAVVTRTAISHKGETTAVAQTTTNSPPVVKDLLLEQTRSGILARPLAEDKEGDRIAFRLRWFINDQLVKGAITARLPPDRYAVGDTVQAEVTPSDSFSSGKPLSSKPLEIVSLERPSRPKQATAGQDTPAPQR